MTADESSLQIRPAAEMQSPPEIRGFASDCERLTTTDEIGTAETRTPNQRIMSRRVLKEPTDLTNNWPVS